MLQMNDGSGWHNLTAYDVPDELVGETVIGVWCDPTLTGYRALEKASKDGAAPLFRINDGEPGRPFRVKASMSPSLEPDRVMFTRTVLTPA
ncbi:hypothetical protein J7E62_27670 [Variovorax paradoxus]|nr:hypothetical protein [Variovorax paradoxus]